MNEEIKINRLSHGWVAIKDWVTVFWKVPVDHGVLPNSTYPKYFSVESALLLPFGLITIAGMAVLITGCLEFMGVLAPLSPVIPFSLVAALLFCIAASIVQAEHFLLSRKVTAEQFEWCFSVFAELNLPTPQEVMTKLDLAIYVETAYLAESKSSPPLD